MKRASIFMLSLALAWAGLIGCQTEDPVAVMSEASIGNGAGVVVGGSGSTILSPAGHYYAASYAEVLTFVNAKLASQGQVATSVTAIDFVDDPRFSFAVVGVMLSTGTPKELLTLFRYTDQVSVSQNGSTIGINGGAPSTTFLDGGLGISASETNVDCSRDGGCSDGDCEFSEASVTLHCSCSGGNEYPGTPQATDDIIITSGDGCTARFVE